MELVNKYLPNLRRFLNRKLKLREDNTFILTDHLISIFGADLDKAVFFKDVIISFLKSIKKHQLYNKELKCPLAHSSDSLDSKELLFLEKLHKAWESESTQINSMIDFNIPLEEYPSDISFDIISELSEILFIAQSYNENYYYFENNEMEYYNFIIKNSEFYLKFTTLPDDVVQKSLAHLLEIRNENLSKFIEIINSNHKVPRTELLTLNKINMKLIKKNQKYKTEYQPLDERIINHFIYSSDSGTEIKIFLSALEKHFYLSTNPKSLFKISDQPFEIFKVDDIFNLHNIYIGFERYFKPITKTFKDNLKNFKIKKYVLAIEIPVSFVLDSISECFKRSDNCTCYDDENYRDFLKLLYNSISHNRLPSVIDIEAILLVQKWTEKLVVDNTSIVLGNMLYITCDNLFDIMSKFMSTTLFPVNSISLHIAGFTDPPKINNEVVFDWKMNTKMNSIEEFLESRKMIFQNRECVADLKILLKDKEEDNNIGIFHHLLSNKVKQFSITSNYDEEDDSIYCISCKRNIKSDIIITNCKHFFCSSCSDSIRECLICHSIIESRQKLFLS